MAIEGYEPDPSIKAEPIQKHHNAMNVVQVIETKVNHHVAVIRHRQSLVQGRGQVPHGKTPRKKSNKGEVTANLP